MTKNYEAPVVEQIEVRMEYGFLTLSDGSATAPNVESMDSEDIINGSW